MLTPDGWGMQPERRERAAQRAARQGAGELMLTVKWTDCAAICWAPFTTQGACAGERGSSSGTVNRQIPIIRSDRPPGQSNKGTWKFLPSGAHPAPQSSRSAHPDLMQGHLAQRIAVVCSRSEEDHRLALSAGKNSGRPLDVG